MMFVLLDSGLFIRFLNLLPDTGFWVSCKTFWRTKKYQHRSYKHAQKLVCLFLFVEELRVGGLNGHILYFKSLISTSASHSTLNVLAEETGTSAWYQALPASPVRLQICCSVLSRVSCKWILNVPIPLPNMWVQNLMQSGMSTPETTKWYQIFILFEYVNATINQFHSNGHRCEPRS